MRLLHTSDWHLGVSHRSASRAEDHDLFFAWLERTLASEAVDALIVAGDVFDVSHPAADAQARFYAFLARLAETGLRQAVIVAGNHDSAARMEAPAEVLRALRVHVVGGIDSTSASWERCLFPLEERSGAVGAVVMAIPYVHEYRLGVRTTDLDHKLVRAAYIERFSAIYRHLADVAAERWPGVPLVATGHLTLGPASREDYPIEIHQVGTLEGLPHTVLDPRIQYTALGHIHRSYRVDPEGRAWYSGSPVAFSLIESLTPRRVLLVDVNPEPLGLPVVRPLEVPVSRRLIELRGAFDEVIAQLRALVWTEPLPPLIFVRVVADVHEPSLARAVQEALDAFPEDRRPSLFDLREERASGPLAEEEGPPPDLTALTPAEVFRTLCVQRGEGEIASLQRAFAQMSSLSAEEFAPFVAAVVGGDR